ncbi:putative TIM-barrel fold metal-dependent hydrolase [Streptosporangium lutulentum]|uniref:TIM-barrel fold metal-dependent hydrolase n=1 Tax=Streptosporangium lutulentum TaxID=1461250 RepID=A0ABT9Q712_9ACTN|nr:amidohydrolase family protein [Streptosporangium lutulentum]MDP9842180.1 putative TIM-barrel fold metal-dependent hydrolase [Streptosporangium lutulentum]
MSIIDARVRLPQELRPSQTYAAPRRQTEQYDKVLQLTDKMNTGRFADLLQVMEDEGIDQAVMHAESEGGESADALNEALCQVLAEHPGRFTGIGCVDIADARPTQISRQTASIAGLGLLGITLQPAFFGLDIDDRRLYPMYSRAEELGLIVAVHTGVTYSRLHPLRHERPELLDQVACDFPDLTLIACHAGWPWVTEYCAVARRHPTVYLEFGALAPKYVARAGTGWDTLFGMMPNVLRDQVLYGSDWPMMSPARAITEWRASGLPDAALQALFHDNASRLFGLMGASQ